MPDVVQNVLVVTVAVVGSLLIMAALNCIWPWDQRRSHNDLIGWQVSILGTTYAVILGFMLYAVWTAFQEADLNVALEANSVVDVYRLAKGLPEPQRTQLQTLARSYADAAVNQDWPEMDRYEVPQQTMAISEQMWNVTTSAQASSPTEINAQQLALSELSSLGQHRLTRILQSTTRLPTVLWCVLLVGGGLTIISACTFGAQNWRLQAVQVISFSLLVSLSLVAIADIHRPFHGLIRVRSYAFLRAQENMRAR